MDGTTFHVNAHEDEKTGLSGRVVLWKSTANTFGREVSNYLAARSMRNCEPPWKNTSAAARAAPGGTDGTRNVLAAVGDGAGVGAAIRVESDCGKSWNELPRWLREELLKFG